MSMKRRNIRIVALGLCTLLTRPAWTAATNLGSIGKTQLQQDTGDAVQLTCGGFVNANANPAAIPLFATCSAMVQTGNAINNTGGATTNDLGLTAAELAASLQQIATEEFAATESMATELTANRAGNVISRLSQLRRNVRGFSLAGFKPPAGSSVMLSDTTSHDKMPRTRGGAAGADGAGGRFGGFVNGSYSTGDREDTRRTDRFDFDTYGITAGMDYRITEQFILGAALSYHDVNSDFDNTPTVNGGGIDAESWGGFLYGTYYVDRFYVDGLAGYARSDYDTKRKIFIPSTTGPAISETAKGSPDSDDITLSLGAGYSLGQGSLSYEPFARVNYSSVDVDDYKENGAEASGLNLRVEGQKWTSLTSVLGGQLAYAVSHSFGVVVPQARAGWIHEFKNSSEQYKAFYIDDPRQNVLRATTDKPDRDYFELGVGVSAVFSSGVQAFFNYDTVLGFSNLTEHLFTVGGRLEF